MSLTRIRELIMARTGLQPDSLGATAVPNAVDERLRVSNTDGFDAYAARLARDPLEFQALIDAIIVPETWFFRGGKIYDALVKHVQAKLAGNPVRPVRILSLPCSTGEEPYSIAVAFTDNGLSPAHWSIDAIDLCSVSIAVAQGGRYRDFSFRETPAELRSRHFAPVGELSELHASIRGRVRFRVGNLFDPASLISDGGRYDVILCRNLMIYLTPAARLMALETLDRLLAVEGLLAVGHAEAGNLHGSQFESVGPDGCFLFQRKSMAEPKSELKARSGPASGGVRPTSAAPASGGPRPPVSGCRVPPSLAKAKRDADAGRLTEALAECQGLVAIAPTAEAYCLLGVVYGAGGKLDQAFDAFRKALYLDPHHRDALTHGLLLAEAKRDTDQAAMYRARLERLGANP